MNNSGCVEKREMPVFLHQQDLRSHNLSLGGGGGFQNTKVLLMVISIKPISILPTGIAASTSVSVEC